MTEFELVDSGECRIKVIGVGPFGAAVVSSLQNGNIKADCFPGDGHVEMDGAAEGEVDLVFIVSGMENHFVIGTCTDIAARCKHPDNLVVAVIRSPAGLLPAFLQSSIDTVLPPSR